MPGPSAVRRRLPAALVAGLLAAGPGLSLPVVARAAKGGGQSTLATSTTNPLSLGGGITAPTPTTTAPAVTATTTSGSGSGGISSTSAIAIALAAVVIIGGIVYAIFRDARRRSGGSRRPSPASGPEDRIPGSKRAPKARKLSSAEKRRRKRGRAPRRH